VNEIADNIQSGKITVHYMNKAAFKKARKTQFPSFLERLCVEAWAVGNHIYLRSDTSRVYDTIVHESEHAMRNIYGPKEHTIDGLRQEEWEVRALVREYRWETGRWQMGDKLCDWFDMWGY